MNCRDDCTGLCFLSDLKCLICTLACAAGTSMLFKLLGVPAPFLLGSMFGVWTVSSLVKPLKRYFSIPRWFYITVVLGLGVLVGFAQCVRTFFRVDRSVYWFSPGWIFDRTNYPRTCSIFDRPIVAQYGFSFDRRD